MALSQFCSTGYEIEPGTNLFTLSLSSTNDRYYSSLPISTSNRIQLIDRVAIEKYLNLPSIRSKLGIPSAFPPFLGCSESINRGFVTRGDLQVTSEHHLAQLLERGVKVLLYDGGYSLAPCFTLISRIVMWVL